MTGRREDAGITTAEFAAQLANDPNYQAVIAERDRQLCRSAARWRSGEGPLVEDLTLAGIQVESVWDLVNTDGPYPDALPILINHLETGNYPDRVMEGIGRALAVKPAVMFWGRLKAAYLAADGPDARAGIATALAASADVPYLDDLVRLISVNENGPSRILLLQPLRDLGGAHGRAALERFTTDPTLGTEATRLLAQNVGKD